MLYSKIFCSRSGIKKLYVFAPILLTAVLLSSCGVWEDFTTYFNTYYNAKNLFDLTEEQILAQRKDIFQFRDQTGLPTSNNQYNIANNSQLANSTTSPFGQDNLTSQNQYNQQNQYSQQNQDLSQQQSQYSQQNQYNQQQTNSQFASTNTGNNWENLRRVVEKCSKILQYDKTSSYFPDALFIIGKALYYQREYVGAQRKFTELAGLNSKKYGLENKLWLAKTHLQLRGFDEGFKLIDEVKEESAKEGNDKLYVEAVVTLIGFYTFRQEYLKATAECKNFLDVSKDDETKALVAFQLGKIYSLLNDEKSAIDAYKLVLKFSPTIEVEFQSRLETARLLKRAKRIDESENILETMRYQGRYKANLYQILIELGKIYNDKNETQKAVSIFRDVDSTYKNTEASGIASEQLAKIYMEKYRDYDSAYKYYTKTTTSIAPSDTKVIAMKQLKNLDRYFDLRSVLRTNIKKAEYAVNNQSFLRDSVDYFLAYLELADEYKRLQEANNSTAPQQLLAQQQQQQFALPVFNIAQQQAALEDLKKNRKTVTLAILVKIGRVKKPERSKVSKDSLNKIIGQNLFDLGNHFFTELEVSDSAEIYLNRSLNDYPNKAIKVQAMFTLGTVYETYNDSVNAKKLFRHIYDSCSTNPLAKASAEKLGLVKEQNQNIATIKSSVNQEEIIASKLYFEAEKKYYDKQFTASVDSFKNIYKKYKSTPFAPKSLYYIGLIYENDLKEYDSAAVYYGLIYLNYDKSPIMALVNNKYTEYMKEKKLPLPEKKNSDKILLDKDGEPIKKPRQDKPVPPDINQRPNDQIPPAMGQPDPRRGRPDNDTTATKKVEL
jgi:tetratricopeptide (TPR) repeat protein